MPEPQALPQLFARIKGTNPADANAAFVQLDTHIKKTIARVISRAPQSEREDITQIARLGVWEKIQQAPIEQLTNPEIEYAAWLHNWCKNALGNHFHQFKAAKRKLPEWQKALESLDCEFDDGEKRNHAIADDLSPDEKANRHEDIAAFQKIIDQTSLSTFERQVLKWHLAGKGQIEIGEKLRTGAKRIDNAIQRIKKKLADPIKRPTPQKKRSGPKSQTGFVGVHLQKNGLYSLKIPTGKDKCRRLHNFATANEAKEARDLAIKLMRKKDWKEVVNLLVSQRSPPTSTKTRNISYMTGKKHYRLSIPHKQKVHSFYYPTLEDAIAAKGKAYSMLMTQPFETVVSKLRKEIKERQKKDK